MNWASLSPLQVILLWGAAAAAALWLYLHNRQPLRRRVSTLNFWASAHVSPQPRRRLRERLAFAAQALFLLLLILALADPRWGEDAEPRSVVVIVDTSLWSRVRMPGEAQWIERERQEALRLISSLPLADRVLLLRTDGDVTPVLPFTTDRAALRRAIEGIRPSSAVADVPRALALAKGALSGVRRGLIAYIGPGMLDDVQARQLPEIRESLQSPAGGPRLQLLMRLVSPASQVANRGIVGIALNRDTTRPERWHVLTKLKNYGANAAPVAMQLSMDGQGLLRRVLWLAPGEIAAVRDDLTLPRAGLLQVEIDPGDPLQADDRAAVYVPSFRPVRVNVVSAHPAFAQELRAVLATNPYSRTEILRPGQTSSSPADVVVYDGPNPPQAPSSNFIWFVSGTSAPAGHSIRLAQWNPQHPATRWIRTRDVNVRRPATLPMQPGDTVLATGTSGAPLIVARERQDRKMLIVGFDPRQSNLPQQSAFPLLLAGAMEWMTQSVEDTAESLSAGPLNVPSSATRIVAPSNREVPFVASRTGVHLLALETGVYRVIGPEGEHLLAVNTPSLPAQRWQTIPRELAPVEPETLQNQMFPLWNWLLVLAMIALWAEWYFFYRSRTYSQAQTLSGHTSDAQLLWPDVGFRQELETVETPKADPLRQVSP